MIKGILRKWLGIKEEEIDWTVIGTLHYSITRTISSSVTTPKKERYEGDAILCVSNKGKRKFNAPHEEMLRDKRARHIDYVSQLFAWEMGGYLPDDFEPIKGPERKEWKISNEVVAMTRPKKGQ